MSPEGGLFNAAQNIEITCATSGAAIYYTLDGTVPTTESTRYTSAISVDDESSPMTISARAFLTSMTPSSTTINTYTVDDLAPVIATEVYGRATDNGWVINWPDTEDDVTNIAFSMTVNGETVTRDFLPDAGTGVIYETDFTIPPASYDSEDVSDIRLIYTDTAGNSTIRAIGINDDPVTFDPGSGYYLDAHSVSLSTTDGGDIYYTINGNAPDLDSELYSGSIYLDGNTLSTTIRAACFKQGKMTFGSSTARINIDFTWDDSFVFRPSGSGIEISWNNPSFPGSTEAHFDSITLDFEKVSDNSTYSQTFSPSNPEEYTCSDGTGIFTVGEAYNISVSATEEGGESVPDSEEATPVNFYYEDLYMRDGIILSTETGADEQPISVTATGGSPWNYNSSETASQLFTGTSPSGSIKKMKRSADGSMLYFIVFEDDPATADQLWSYDFSTAPTELSSSAGDVIDFTFNDAGNPVYLAAADIEGTSYSIITLTPGTPSTENEEYSYAPTLGPPSEIEMFDSGNLIIRFETGELSAHEDPATPTVLTPSRLAGITDVSAVFGTPDGLLYISENIDGVNTDIFELTDLDSPPAGRIGQIGAQGLVFHDISAGGKNIIFSAVDYSDYSGEHLFVYNTTFNAVMEIMQLTGTSYEGLTGAAW